MKETLLRLALMALNRLQSVLHLDWLKMLLGALFGKAEEISRVGAGPVVKGGGEQPATPQPSPSLPASSSTAGETGSPVRAISAKGGGTKPAAPRPLVGSVSLSVLLTNYWIVDLSDPDSYREHKGGDREEWIEVIGAGSRKFPSRFLNAVRLEGCGRTPENVLGYDGKIWYFQDSQKFPWGSGASGLALVPFKSIATDKALIPMRTRCFIDELVDLELPNGETHDGNVTAVDTGGAIKEAHVDLFVGLKKWRIDHLVPRGTLWRPQ